MDPILIITVLIIISVPLILLFTSITNVQEKDKREDSYYDLGFKSSVINSEEIYGSLISENKTVNANGTYLFENYCDKDIKILKNCLEKRQKSRIIELTKETFKLKHNYFTNYGKFRHMFDWSINNQEVIRTFLKKLNNPDINDEIYKILIFLYGLKKEKKINRIIFGVSEKPNLIGFKNKHSIYEFDMHNLIDIFIFDNKKEVLNNGTRKIDIIYTKENFDEIYEKYKETNKKEITDNILFVIDKKVRHYKIKRDNNILELKTKNEIKKTA